MTPTQWMGAAFAIGGGLFLVLVGVCCCVAAGRADRRTESQRVTDRAVAAGFVKAGDKR